MNLFYRWLWYLVPANPIVVRVVQGGSRRLRHLWVRMVYLGAMILLVMIGLLLGGGMASDVSLTDLAKAGAIVFSLVAYGQVILVCLLAPLFMAGAIHSERSGETLDILLTTPLSNLQIVLGVLLSRLYFVLALLASGLPLFAVLLIFGGVPIGSVFVAFGAAGLTALLVGSVALLLSVLRTGGRKAVFAFVISVAGYLVASYLADVLVVRHLMPVPGSTTWLTPAHPLLVLEASLNPASYKPPPVDLLGAYPRVAQLYLSRPFASFALLTGIGSLAMILFSALQVRRVGTEARWAWLRRALRLRSGGERRRPPRQVWLNPVAWREASTRGAFAGAILARWAFAAIGLGLGALLLLLHHFQGLPRLTTGGGVPMPPDAIFHALLLTLLLLELAVIVLVAVYVSAGAVSREREDGTLDLMLTTPITPRQYIWGKLRGLVSFLSLLLAVPILTLALTSAYTMAGMGLGWETALSLYTSGGGSARHELILPEAPLLLALTLVPFVALCVMVGMSWSLKARGVLGAVAPSVAIIGLLSLVLGFCGYVTVRSVPILGPILNAFSPVTSLTVLVNPFENAKNFLENPAAGRVMLLLGALVSAGGYSLIVYVMLLGMVRGFDQTVRRLSGQNA